jgi:hypothetical protein
VHDGESAGVRIDVTSAGVRMTKACRARVRRRVLVALCRFGPQLERAAVHVTESRHPLGGSDQCCRIRARLSSGRVLEAEAVDSQPEGAAGRSALRLALFLAATCGDGARTGVRALRDRWSVE